MKTLTRTASKSGIIGGAFALVLLGGCACPDEQPPAAEPAPMAQPAAMTTTEAFSLDAAELFDFDKADLRPEGVAALKGAVQKYRGNARLRSMEIVGHTDSAGTDEYNQDLSERRADAVRDHFIQEGVDGSKITASGRGESEPVASNDTAEGRQKNRRVEVRAVMEREVTR